MNQLAIIIPAFKAKFFEDTLKSLANQTDLNFNIYIGNDCGEKEIETIVDRYKDKLNIDYKYFNTNLGSKNLTEHWKRCFEMIKNENYFILFSDDDILEKNAIEEINKSILSNPTIDVMHLNLKIINGVNEIIEEKQIGYYKKIISSEQFFKDLNNNKIMARMQDFIIKKSSFMKNGGFVSFPLAMYSDNATIIKNALSSGILQLESTIYWRRSDVNISSNINQNIIHSKYYVEASIMYYKWVKDYLPNINISEYEEIRKTFLNSFGIQIGYQNRKNLYIKYRYTKLKRLSIEVAIKSYILLKNLKKIKLN